MGKKAESKDTHSNAEEGARDREKAEGGFLGVLRVATYLGVTDDDVERAVEAIPRALVRVPTRTGAPRAR